ncbi:MAG: adenosylmethionine decarboxylase [Candidatus Baldrarchaeia archaeon]
MKGLGWHVIAELSGVDPKVLDDEQLLIKIMVEAAKKAGLTVLATKTHKFSPQGVSAVVIVSESHLFIHTWPEFGYAALDVFSCKDEESTWTAYNEIVKKLRPRGVQVIMIKRGMLQRQELPVPPLGQEGYQIEQLQR